MTETKVRNLVYEVELKYQTQPDFDEALINLIKKGLFEVDASRRAIKFAIQSPLLKQAFEYQVRQLGGVSDGSFAKHLVTIKEVTFAKLLDKLYHKKVNDSELQKLFTELKSQNI